MNAQPLAILVAAAGVGVWFQLPAPAEEKEAVPAVQETALSTKDQAQLELAVALDKKAEGLRSIGTSAAAEEASRSALAIRERVQGAEHPEAIESRFWIAFTLDAQRKHAESEAEYRAVVALRERALGVGDITTLATRYNLAITLDEQGKLAEAEAETRAVVAIHERVRGAEHSATLMNRKFLAMLLRKQGRHAEEEAEHRAILANYERTLGAEHHQSALSCWSLAQCLEDQRKTKEALSYARRALAILKKGAGKYDSTPTGLQEMVTRLESSMKEGGKGKARKDR